MEAWELALESWVDCRPQGYTIDERKVRARLPNIVARVPRNRPGAWEDAGGMDPWEIFVPASRSSEPVFLTLLRPQSGRVHFLHFWKAFGEAMHLAQQCPSEGLVAELETLRDRLLRRIEEEARAVQSQEPDADSSSSRSSFSPQKKLKQAFAVALPTWALVEEVHCAGSMSEHPRFWQRCSETMAGQLELKELGLEELTSVLLAWLHDAQLYEQQLREELAVRQQLESSPASAGLLTALTSFLAPAREEGMPVFLHIYDVSNEEGIQKLNRILAHQSSWFKLGGVFHAGVEVNGLEWSYGYSPSEKRPGVACAPPRTHPQHHYRQTVALCHTTMSPEDIADIISKLVDEYPGYDYSLLRRNCCHFADEFCQRLGVGGIPGWVHRLARLGAGVETILQSAPKGLKDQFIVA